MNPILNHTRVASSAPSNWLFLLHGIYGNGRNWGSLARRITEARPDWGVILVDLRMHGGSIGFDPPHTVSNCADDVSRLAATLDLPVTAILGHSFGGKVALAQASAAASSPRQVWVVDSTLRIGEPSGQPWSVIGIVRSLPDEFPSREALADALVRQGFARGVGLWLAMNLEREGSVFRWRLDWDAMEEMLRDYFATDVWPVVENPPEGTEVRIIRARSSDSIGSADISRIEQAAASGARVTLHQLDGGHWLNVDNPDGVLELLAEHLPRG